MTKYGKHLLDKTKDHKIENIVYKCDDCGMTFDRKERLEAHDHYIARKSHETEPFETYELVDADSALGRMILSQPSHEGITVCRERKIAIEGLYPCFHIPAPMFQNKTSSKLWESCGNTHGVSTLEKVSIYVSFLIYTKLKLIRL